MIAARPLAPDDLPALRDLARLARSEGFGFLERFVHDLEAGSIALTPDAASFYVLVDQSDIIAVGGVTSDPYLAQPHVGRIRHVYVVPHRRGAGLGRRLLEILEARASRAGYRQLRLRTDAPAAARFYERLGYTAVDHESATHSRALPIERRARQSSER